MGALLLVGMGYRNLSMNGRSVARIKYLLRHIDLADAEVLAQRVLNTQMTTEVRHLVAAFMERRGMGGLIRGADSRRACDFLQNFSRPAGPDRAKPML